MSTTTLLRARGGISAALLPFLIKVLAVCIQAGRGLKLLRLWSGKAVARNSNKIAPACMDCCSSSPISSALGAVWRLCNLSSLRTPRQLPPVYSVPAAYGSRHLQRWRLWSVVGRNLMGSVLACSSSFISRALGAVRRSCKLNRLCTPKPLLPVYSLPAGYGSRQGPLLVEGSDSSPSLCIDIAQLATADRWHKHSVPAVQQLNSTYAKKHPGPYINPRLRQLLSRVVPLGFPNGADGAVPASRFPERYSQTPDILRPASTPFLPSVSISNVQLPVPSEEDAASWFDSEEADRAAMQLQADMEKACIEHQQLLAALFDSDDEDSQCAEPVAPYSPHPEGVHYQDDTHCLDQAEADHGSESPLPFHPDDARYVNDNSPPLIPFHTMSAVAAGAVDPTSLSVICNCSHCREAARDGCLRLATEQGWLDRAPPGMCEPAPEHVTAYAMTDGRLVYVMRFDMEGAHSMYWGCIQHALPDIWVLPDVYIPKHLKNKQVVTSVCPSNPFECKWMCEYGAFKKNSHTTGSSSSSSSTTTIGRGSTSTYSSSDTSDYGNSSSGYAGGHGSLCPKSFDEGFWDLAAYQPPSWSGSEDSSDDDTTTWASGPLSEAELSFLVPA